MGRHLGEPGKRQSAHRWYVPKRRVPRPRCVTIARGATFRDRAVREHRSPAAAHNNWNLPHRGGSGTRRRHHDRRPNRCEGGLLTRRPAERSQLACRSLACPLRARWSGEPPATTVTSGQEPALITWTNAGRSPPSRSLPSWNSDCCQCQRRAWVGGLHPARKYQPSTRPVKGSKILWPRPLALTQLQRACSFCTAKAS